MLLTNRRRSRRGFSLIELLIVIAIILVIAAIAAPRLMSAKQQAQEMAAIRQINTIHTGQTQYMSQFGKFAESLAQLGPPASGSPGPGASDLIPDDLSKGEKTGYVFTMVGGQEGYTVTAVPKVFNTTGRRTFFSDQSMEVHENWGPEPATRQSPTIK